MSKTRRGTDSSEGLLYLWKTLSYGRRRRTLSPVTSHNA